MYKLFRDIYCRRELLFMLIGRNLKIRYKSSILGFFWSLLGPILMIVIYALFARILRFSGGKPNYVQFLVVGLVVWQFHVMCLNDSLHAVMGNVSLVKKTVFPRIILPLSTILADLVNFLLTGVVVVLYLAVMRTPLGAVWLLPPILLTQLALSLGGALVISTANVFFRDTEHILSVITLAWFFLTPVFYPLELQLSALPEAWRWLTFVNPMTGLVGAYRAVMLAEPWPPAGGLMLSCCVAWAVLAIGMAVFQTFQVRFGDEL